MTEQTTPAPPLRTSGSAIASLVLGIAGIFVLPVVLSVLAIIFGKRAKDEIDSSEGVGGEGLATAGVVLGWIGLALGIIGVLFLLLLAA